MRIHPAHLLVALLGLCCPAFADETSDASLPSYGLDSDELARAPGTLGDPARAPLLLPGAGAILSGVSQPVVRGMQPAQTAFFFDGVRVPYPFHLFAGPSAFPGASVESVKLYPGPAPLRAGARLGAVVELEPVPMSRAPRAAASLDLLFAGASIAQPLSTGTDVQLGGRFGWTPLLATAALSSSSSRLLADIFDYQARVEHRLGDGSLRLLAFGLSDAGGQDSPSQKVFAGLGSHRVDLRLRSPAAGGLFEAGATAGWDQFRFHLGGTDTVSALTATERSLAARASYSVQANATVSVEVGGSVERRGADVLESWQTVGPRMEGEAEAPPIYTRAMSPVGVETVAAAYVEANLAELPTRWQPAVRFVDYHLDGVGNFFAVEPRLGVSRALGEAVTLRASAALVHQPATHLIDFPGSEIAGLRFGLQEELRVDAGLEVRGPSGLVFSAQAYGNPILRSFELSPLDRDFLQSVKGPAAEIAPGKQSDGYVYGIELVARRQLTGRWFGWVGYTFQRSVRKASFPVRNEFGEPVGTSTAYLPTQFEHQHAADAVASYQFGNGWTVGGGLHFNSGGLEAGGLYSFTQRQGEDRLRPGPKWIEANLDQVARVPPFFRLDARVSRGWRFQSFALDAYLDLQNLTLSKEPTGGSYSDSAASLEDRSAGRIVLVRKSASSMVPAPLPMLGARAVF